MGRKNEKHGATKTTEYRIWQNMRNRCQLPTATAFDRYGGRGISVCVRWRTSFSAFLADMGPRPSIGHSIDRIDNDGHYEPGNCRRATKATQTANRQPRRDAKLSPVLADIMTTVYWSTKFTQPQLAKWFGVSRGHVTKVVRGMAWGQS